MVLSLFKRVSLAVCVGGALLALTSVGCSSASLTAGSGCPANQALVNGTCVQLCSFNADCAPGQACSTGGTCEAAGADVLDGIPIITGINGNGSEDGTPGHTANRLATGVVITGNNLAHTTEGFAVTLLDESGVPTDLTTMVMNSSQEALTLMLPSTLTSDTNYTIRVANQFGSDQTTVLILQGEAGTAGAAGMNAVCEANCGETTPNTPRQTTIELRAVNPVNDSVKSSIRIDTGGATTLQNIEPTSAGSGLLVALVDMNSTVVGAHALATIPANPTPFFTQYDAVVALLDSVMPGTLVGVATYGDITALQSGTRVLADLLTSLESLGAPPEIRNITASEGFVFLGHRRIGKGNGAFARMNAADAPWDLDEDTGTTGDTGRAVWTRQWLANDQLVGVQSRPSGVFSQPVIANAGVTANDGMVVSTAGALQVGSVADVVNLGTDALTAGAMTGSSLTVGSGALTGGAITGSSLAVGSGAITGGAITGSSLTATSGTVGGLVISASTGTLPTGGSFFVGGDTSAGVDGGRFHHTAEQTFIDSKGTNTSITLRADDVDGSTALVDFGTTGTNHTQHMRLGGGTQSTAVGNLAPGDLVLDNGTAAPPAVHFLNGADSNWGIDVATDSLRVVQDLNESGGVARLVVLPTGATVDGTVTASAFSGNSFKSGAITWGVTLSPSNDGTASCNNWCNGGKGACVGAFDTSDSGIKSCNFTRSSGSQLSCYCLTITTVP